MTNRRDERVPTRRAPRPTGAGAQKAPRPTGAGAQKAAGRTPARRTSPPRTARPVPARRPVPVRGPVHGGPRTRAGSTPVGSPRRRQTIVLGLMLAVLAVFGVRLVTVQGLQGEAIARAALDQRLFTVAIPGDRGEIVDANGVVLATSVERYDIVVNQRLIGQAMDTGVLDLADISDDADELGALLGIPGPELGPRLLGDRGYVFLAKGVEPETYRKVMELGVTGVTGERTTERIYPAGTTAGNIVGFVGAEGEGLAGLEQTYDEQLRGTAGSRTYERGAAGQRIPTGQGEVVPAVPGRDVVLTIDSYLQYQVQSALDEQVRKTGARWGAVEVVDTRTGEILALADSHAVDPNDPGAVPATDRGSRASWAAYEPGSTAKVVTMAAILETGVASPTSQFVVPDVYEVPNGQSFKDSHPHPDLKLTLNGILAESSNTGTVMVGSQLPKQVRHDYLKKFGFGSPTSVGLPGEGSGILADADDWDGRSEYAVLFGQAVSVTTLQATQVFATIANGGVHVQPHLVRATVDADGVEHPNEDTETRRVISEETAQTLMTMLESAVRDGTGGNAEVPGYRIAGKTGTAQAFEGGGVVKNVASFIGVAPADDPHIVVNVVLYDPKSSIYGGSVAAPVFSEVTGYALQHLGVPPSDTPPELFPITYE